MKTSLQFSVRLLFLVFILQAVTVKLTGADAIATPEKTPPTPLTPELLGRIQNNPYVNETVQTTNGEKIGTFTEVVFDMKSGRALFGVIQVFDNISNTKDFVAMPWSLLSFDERDRQIQVRATVEQLRTAPRFNQHQAARLAQTPDLAKVHDHFGVAVGGGPVGGGMGMQTGSGSSASAVPPTDAAQPARGSVAAMYILAALALGMLAGRYIFRARA